MLGIFLIDENTKEVLNFFKYVHATGWASNSVRFCLRVLIAKNKAIQLNFATTSTSFASIFAPKFQYRPETSLPLLA